MCFIAPNTIKPQVADKDIVCYKEMWCEEKVYTPAWYQFWKPKVTKVVGFCSVIQGYKYTPYTKNPTITLAPFMHPVARGVDTYMALVIEEGYHSYDKDTTRNGPRWDSPCYKRVECIIPKGSTYYFFKGLFVSSDIIITDKTTSFIP